MERKYGRVTRQILEKLSDIVGKESISTKENEIEDFSHDEAPLATRHVPEVIIRPVDTLSVSGLMRFADKERIPVEVKYRTVQHDLIKQLQDFMRILQAKRAILITNSSVTSKINKLAAQNNIYLIDNVQSEEDIVKGLKQINIA